MERAVVATLAEGAFDAQGEERRIHISVLRRIRERRITYPIPTLSFGLTLPNLGPIIRNRFQTNDSHQV